MSRTKLSPKPLPVPSSGGANGSIAEVLTLSEAAAYLRLAEPEVVRLVWEQELPGRLAGSEWRFLKAGLQDWLSKGLPRPSKEAQLAVAGSWQDDPYLQEMLQEIYKNRGRPMVEEP